MALWTGPETVEVVRDPNEAIPGTNLRPHHSDPRFTIEDSPSGLAYATHTIYLAPDADTRHEDGKVEVVPGAYYLDELGFALMGARTAREVTEQTVDGSARAYEARLQQKLKDNTLRMRHILSTVNAMSGSGYMIFGVTGDALPEGAEPAERLGARLRIR